MFFLHLLLPFWWFYTKFQLAFLVYDSLVDSNPRLVWLGRCRLFVECVNYNCNVNYKFFKFRYSPEFFFWNCLWSKDLQNLTKAFVNENLDSAKILFVTFHVSQPYSRTESTLFLKNFSFTFQEIWWKTGSNSPNIFECFKGLLGFK